MKVRIHILLPLKNLVARLISDDRGAVASMELILMGTILMLGMIGGLSTWRNAVVQELGDSAAAVSELNQSYGYNESNVNKIYRTNDGGFVRVIANVSGSRYVDRRDAGQPPTTDPPGAAPMGISFAHGPTNEQ